ncbi:MAG TPA: tetratricopeptide repeat protein [Cyclobacteriaceae bacterium]
MKTAVLAGVLSLVFTFDLTLTGFAQCNGELKWPEDGAKKAKAQESLVLLNDNKRSGAFKQAIPPLNWLIANAPDLSKNIYIYGAEVYDGLAKKETDPAKKAKYADSLVAIYDLRLKYTPCDEEASILNRKALAAYIYYINSDKAKDLQKYMDDAFDKNGAEIMDGTLIPFMQTIQVNYIKEKTLTDEQVIERYDKLSEILDKKIKEAQGAGKPIDRYQKYQSQIDDIFISLNIPMNCDDIKKKLEPRFNANPKDVGLAKQIFRQMLMGKCTDDPLWLKAGEVLVEAEPDFAIMKNLAIRYLAQDETAKAEAMFKKALGIATDKSDKGDILMLLGSVEAKKGNNVGARDYFRQALAADGRKEAYEKIGDLYFNSGNECKELDNQADDRRVYLIAYDYYQKAGDSQKMQQAKQQFPSKEELFLMNYKAGTPVRVECWINEATTWRTRD